MEAYKKKLLNSISCYIGHIYENVEDMARHINDHPNYIINRNEEGKVHSRYLGDRYEPAIIHRYNRVEKHYYIFDGEILDCDHPFRIVYLEGNITAVEYYSSERIKEYKPSYINLNLNFRLYNAYLLGRDVKPVLKSYLHKMIKGTEQNDYALHDAMGIWLRFVD